MEEKIKIGISSCLLGENVRYDSGHKHDRYITDTLGNFFDWIPTCPEVAIGLGVPRPSIRLQFVGKETKLIEPRSENDLTEKMKAFSKRRVKSLAKEGLCGYILKSKSPSCGMARLKIYRGYAERPATNGVGVFAEELLSTNLNLPIEEEGRLMDPVLRENWIRRVFAFYNFKKMVAFRPSIGKLVKFHSAYKFVVLSHCPKSYKELGQIVANAKSIGINESTIRYEKIFMTALKKKATRAKNVNVMEHLLGFFKKELDSHIRQEILQTIKDFRDGYTTIIVPITIIRHYANILEIDYLMNQAYLNPHPKQLALLSTI